MNKAWPAARGASRPWTTPSHLLALVALFALGLLVPGTARAATCSSYGGGGIQLAGSFSVPRDLPVGDPVDSSVTQTITMSCSGVSNNDQYADVRLIFDGAGAVIQAADGGFILPTTHAGVGLEVNPVSGGVTYDPSIRGFVIGRIHSYDGPFWNPGSGTAQVSLRFQLVKTGDIAPGTVSFDGDLLHFDYVTARHGSRTIRNSAIDVPGTEYISVISCDVDIGSQNQTVALQTVDATALPSVGSTTGDKDFAVQLTCQSGVQVSIRMHADQADPSHDGVVLPTSGAGYAGGVGVQLLDGNGAPVVFDAKRGLGASPDGALSIPFTARYYRTGTPVTGGQVAATVTFDMFYE